MYIYVRSSAPRLFIVTRFIVTCGMYAPIRDVRMNHESLLSTVCLRGDVLWIMQVGLKIAAFVMVADDTTVIVGLWNFVGKLDVYLSNCFSFLSFFFFVRILWNVVGRTVIGGYPSRLYYIVILLWYCYFWWKVLKNIIIWYVDLKVMLDQFECKLKFDSIVIQSQNSNLDVI